MDGRISGAVGVAVGCSRSGDAGDAGWRVSDAGVVGCPCSGGVVGGVDWRISGAAGGAVGCSRSGGAVSDVGWLISGAVGGVVDFSRSGGVVGDAGWLISDIVVARWHRQPRAAARPPVAPPRHGQTGKRGALPADRLPRATWGPPCCFNASVWECSHSHRPTARWHRQLRAAARLPVAPSRHGSAGRSEAPSLLLVCPERPGGSRVASMRWSESAHTSIGPQLAGIASQEQLVAGRQLHRRGMAQPAEARRSPCCSSVPSDL